MDNLSFSTKLSVIFCQMRGIFKLNLLFSIQGHLVKLPYLINNFALSQSVSASVTRSRKAARTSLSAAAFYYT
jgi:hypothetical protein